MKRRIRLTESDLHRIIKESVNRVLKEDIEKMDFYILSHILHQICEDSDLDTELETHVSHQFGDLIIQINSDEDTTPDCLTFERNVEYLVYQFDDYGLNVIDEIKYLDKFDNIFKCRVYSAFIKCSIDKTNPKYQESEKIVKEKMMQDERRKEQLRQEKEREKKQKEQEEQLRQEREKEEREKILSRIASSRKPYPQKKREKGKYDDVVPQKTITQLPSSDTKSYYRTNDDFYWNK